MFCVAIIDETRIINTPNGDEEITETVRHELPDLKAVLRYLRAYHDRNVTEIADSISDGRADADEWNSIGGFTVKLENQHGHTVEIALGIEFALFMRLQPEPLQIYRNGPDSDEILDFFIDGGHHTEFELRELAYVDDCIKCLTKWLESGEFPSNAG